MKRIRKATLRQPGARQHQPTANNPTCQHFHPAFRADASADATSEALGGLMVYLLRRPLPPQERRVGWALAEKWLGEIVEARHFHVGAV